MAGGNITRIIGGSNTIETETWEVFTEDFHAYAVKGSHFTADGGTIIGEPKEAPSTGQYFVKGWWTDKNDNAITKARIGDTIRFHIETRNIPKNDKFIFKIIDYDGVLSNNELDIKAYYPNQ